MQARGFLNYSLKYCWAKLSTIFVNQINLNEKLRKKLGRPKIWGGMAYPGPPSASPLILMPCVFGYRSKLKKLLRCVENNVVRYA